MYLFVSLANGCSKNIKIETERGSYSLEIVRIEGYSSLDEQKDFTIENNKEIEKILGILDQSNEVLKEQKEISNLVESYYLECYKPLVTVIKSEAKKLYIIF